MFKNGCGAHGFEQEFAFVGYHTFRFTVKELAIQLCAVAENYKYMCSFAKVMMKHNYSFLFGGGVFCTSNTATVLAWSRSSTLRM